MVSIELCFLVVSQNNEKTKQHRNKNKHTSCSTVLFCRRFKNCDWIERRNSKERIGFVMMCLALLSHAIPLMIIASYTWLMILNLYENSVKFSA